MVKKAQIKNENKFCWIAFDSVVMGEQNMVSCCYNRHLPFGIYDGTNFKDLWNSDNAQKIRRAILDGTFKYCNLDTCEFFQTLPTISNVQNKYYKKIIKEGLAELAKGPKRIIHGMDRSCNLSCPSCRTTKYQNNDLKELQKQHRSLMNLLQDNNNLQEITITGSGDPFGSLSYRKFLETIDGSKYPDLSITLKTNGVLLTEKQWDRMSNIHNNINRIDISIDAATEKTYNILRRGGNWSLLLENLEFLSKIKNSANFELRMNIVVQYLNYKEMPDIVRLYQKYKFDRLIFEFIYNWGTFSDKEFKKHNIADPNHPQYKDFLNVLSDPIMSTYCNGNTKVDMLINEVHNKS